MHLGRQARAAIQSSTTTWSGSSTAYAGLSRAALINRLTPAIHAAERRNRGV